jgi:hypothetical protein
MTQTEQMRETNHTVSECLGDFSMRLAVPFIAPRQLGAVEDNLGRLILPSVVSCTGQSL